MPDTAALVGLTALDEARRQHAPAYEPGAKAPACEGEPELQIVDATGRPAELARMLAAYWHRPPYAMALRLVRRLPGAPEPEIVDEAVIGTRGSRAEFRQRAAATVARLRRDATEGTSRGAATAPPPPLPRARRADGLVARLDHLRARWRERVLTERWSIGAASASLEGILATGDPGPVQWLRPLSARGSLADPFPWPGTGQLLCEEMPLSAEFGTVVALREVGGKLAATGAVERSAWLLDDGRHHSYPCTFQEGDVVYVIPEDREPGETTLYQVDAAARLTPVCRPAPGRQFADPTLFHHEGRYWIACTDIAIGHHDNLCLFHADRLAGPWTAHRCTPVKIDIRGARPAGQVFRIGGQLFRPAQDCALTYGAAVVIHRIDMLTPDRFRETPVAMLRPDPAGPFPRGLHTLSAGDGRVWIDGKRSVLDLPMLLRKLARRAGLGGELTGQPAARRVSAEANVPC